MNTVLIVSIGPVQDFIARARKCRDLWYGSWLLSELAKAAAEKMRRSMEGQGGALIFPGGVMEKGLSPGSILSVANKVLARVAGDKDFAKNLAEAGEKAALTRLEELRDKAFGFVGKDFNNQLDPKRIERFHEQTAKKQVEALIEYYWAAVEEKQEDGADSGYDRARREAERLIQARKNTKVWKQPSWTLSGVPKCSLDGARESVLDESLFGKISNKSGGSPSSPAELRRYYGVHPSERLCGVGLLKRHGVGLLKRHGVTLKNKRERVFSTTHLACLPFLVGVTRKSVEKTEENSPKGQISREPENKYDKAWKEYLQTIEEIGSSVNGSQPGNISPKLDELPKISDNLLGGRNLITEKHDGAIFYPERLREAMEEVGCDNKNFEEAHEALKKCLREWDHGDPGTYYAVVLGDGDRMGKKIDSIKDYKEHEDFSKDLADFAKQAKDIVEDNAGSLIYSGGDDVLALVPLHRFLPCVQELNKGFHDCLEKWTNSQGAENNKNNEKDEKDEKDNGRGLSFSIGAAIVHHLLPLDEALSLARAAERRAKQDAGRDALAITVNKRGGTPVEVHGKWGGEDSLPGSLAKLMELFDQDLISSRTGYELMELERLLPQRDESHESSPKTDKKTIMAEVVKTEAERILNRKRQKKGTEKVQPQVKKLLEGSLGEDPSQLGKRLYVARVLTETCKKALEDINPGALYKGDSAPSKDKVERRNDR